MRIQLLLTGNELMAGDTVDSNSSAIAQRLGRHGLQIYRKVTIGDDVQLLCDEIRHMSRHSDVLIINGGLGPTIDDLTAETLALAAGLPLEQHPAAMAHLEQWCARRKYALNEANRKQAMLPAGVDIIPNASGSAVGFMLRFNDCDIYCTPGVPSELFGMLDDSIIDDILHRAGDIDPVQISRFKMFGIGESGLQQLLSDRFPDWPEALELGFRAGLPLLEVKLTTRSSAHSALQTEWTQKLLAVVGDYIIGRDDTNLAQSVVQGLNDKGVQLCTAESCTGGRIAAQLVEIAGASQVFEAGFVTYSDAIKQSALGVSAATLAQHGAVSEAVVLEMAAGAAQRSGAEFAIAVSGIAGPEGGSEDKPVGTVWLAWGRANALRARALHIPGSRDFFQTLVTALALDLTRRSLYGIDAEPRYFAERSAQAAKANP